MRTQRFWLCLAPAVSWALDVVLTLACQADTYWQGSYRTAQEVNPVARHLLALHPGVFTLGAVAWVLCGVALVLRLPKGVAVALAFVLTLLHATGAATCLVRGGIAGWLCAVAVLLGVERLLAWSWARASISERAGA
ncbi:MAG: hypothetical protein AMK72_11615 [Planctomycetes bacterium SM23_25]|nr:MAG: hypothetical protein AMS14_04300 [Planctomycetes bacterium DG_20]KPK44815.1 MAG: hypothetical protein AMK72_11615 [Planctomycetes bacterium SM23_25]